MMVENGMNWKELNMAISKAMQIYCGGIKCEELLFEGLNLLDSYEKEIVPKLSCNNPHDLMRTHEVLDILTVSKLIINACLLRESSSRALCFNRSDFPEMDPCKDKHFITIRNEKGEIIKGTYPLDYYCDLEDNYELYNKDYIGGAK